MISAEAPSDSELVERARSGDDGAFRLLLQRHQDAVAAIAIRMIGPGDEADDVGQETFVRFHASLATFRGESSVRTFLVRIAMNLSLNALRQRRWQLLRFVRQHDKGASHLASTEPLLDATAIDRERAERVTRALGALDDKHRAVVVLRFFEDQSTKEAALTLGVPEGTVMSRLKRALEKMRPMLGDLMEAHDAL